VLPLCFLYRLRFRWLRLRRLKAVLRVVQPELPDLVARGRAELPEQVGLPERAELVLPERELLEPRARVPQQAWALQRESERVRLQSALPLPPPRSLLL
jgi:hypothetical protein